MQKQTAEESPRVGDLMTRLVEGLGQLLAQHVALARLELTAEMRETTRALGRVAVLSPLLVVGYAMLCLALAFALSPGLGIPGAMAVVGAANLVGGGLGLWRVRNMLLQRPRLTQTAEAARESAAALVAQAREARGVH